MKRKVISFVIMIVLTSVFIVIAAYDPVDVVDDITGIIKNKDKVAYHELRYITSDSNGMSVDKNEDGVIDLAEALVGGSGTPLPTCTEGQILKYSAGTWICAVDEGGSGTTLPSCAEDQIMKVNAAGNWECSEDIGSGAGFAGDVKYAVYDCDDSAHPGRECSEIGTPNELCANNFGSEYKAIALDCYDASANTAINPDLLDMDEPITYCPTTGIEDLAVYCGKACRWIDSSATTLPVQTAIDNGATGSCYWLDTSPDQYRYGYLVTKNKGQLSTLTLVCQDTDTNSQNGDGATFKYFICG
jgi:hypothetical protein